MKLYYFTSILNTLFIECVSCAKIVINTQPVNPQTYSF